MYKHRFLTCKKCHSVCYVVIFMVCNGSILCEWCTKHHVMYLQLTDFGSPWHLCSPICSFSYSIFPLICFVHDPPPPSFCHPLSAAHTVILSLKPLSVFHLLLLHTVPHSPAVLQSPKHFRFLSHLAVAPEPTLTHSVHSCSLASPFLTEFFLFAV